jgi:hypothetical protein
VRLCSPPRLQRLDVSAWSNLRVSCSGTVRRARSTTPTR